MGVFFCTSAFSFIDDDLLKLPLSMDIHKLIGRMLLDAGADPQSEGITGSSPMSNGNGLIGVNLERMLRVRKAENSN